MLISIDLHSFLQIKDGDPLLLKHIHYFWSLMAEQWFDANSRMSNLYVEEKQAEENILTTWIIARAFKGLIYQPESVTKLPKPDDAQKKAFEFYLEELEARQTTYTFYDENTQMPTRARWLIRLLDKWDIELNNPKESSVMSYRDLTGTIQSGKPHDDLLEHYIKSQRNVSSVITYCRKLSDHTLMQAFSSIGGHRGPFGEFASFAHEALQKKIRSYEESNDPHLISKTEDYHYDLLLDCASKYFLTINAFTIAYQQFLVAFAEASDSIDLLDQDKGVRCQINSDKLSGHLEKYCKALKSVSDDALELKSFLVKHYPQTEMLSSPPPSTLTSKRTSKHKPSSILSELLNKIIISANNNLKIIIGSGLATVETAENLTTAQLHEIIQVEAPLGEEILGKLAEEFPPSALDDALIAPPRQSLRTRSQGAPRRHHSKHRDSYYLHHSQDDSSTFFAPKSPPLAATQEARKPLQGRQPPGFELFAARLSS